MIIKQKIADIAEKGRQLIGEGKERLLSHIIPFFKTLVERARKDAKERNRILILAFSLLFFLDYLMFSHHIEKNVFDIFTSIPLLEDTRAVTLHLPALDGKLIMLEKREIPVYDADEKLVKHLFNLVVKGSIYENTSFIVPNNIFVRKVWIFGGGAKDRTGLCVIDVDSDIIPESSFVLKGSESLFRKALEETITLNIPSIKNVIIVEKGIPDKNLWEM